MDVRVTGPLGAASIGAASIGAVSIGAVSIGGWVSLGLAIVAAQRVPVRIHISHQTHSIDLFALPLVVGAALMRPSTVIVGSFAGACVAQLWNRRRPVQTCFNVANEMAGVGMALAVMGSHPLASALGPAPGIAAGMLAYELFTGAGVAGVMIATGETPSLAYVREVCIQLLLLIPFCAALATVAVDAYRTQPWALALLAGPAVGLAVWYGWAERLRTRFADMKALYSFSAALATAKERPEVLAMALERAADILRCHHVEIAVLAVDRVARYSLVPDSGVVRSDHPLTAEELDLLVAERGCAAAGRSRWLEQRGFREAMAVPIKVDGEAPSMMITADRRGDTSAAFGPDDLVLLEAMGAHLAIALTACAHLDRLRAEAEAREHQAFHDSLTGLGNRSLFSRAVSTALAKRTGTRLVGVLLMDLNGFKEINDTLGHHTGDEVLRAVASRLEVAIGADCVAARLGGDEFAFVVPDAEDVEELEAAARVLVESVAAPLEIGGMGLSLRGSVGIAVAPFHGSDPDPLMKCADVAMYAAKHSSRNIAVYDPAVDHTSTRRLRLAAELQKAVETGGLRLHFQPVADLATGSVSSVEALLRWNHPQLGSVPPDEFVAVAEQTGLIEPITDWVIEEALRHVGGWRDRGYDLSVAVNISARSLLDLSVVERVMGLVRASTVPADKLTLEITESSVMLEFERSCGILDRFSACGISLAIDDFGTGYSSLSRLKTLPVDIVKVDKSFVRNFCHDIGDQAIIRSTIELARILGHTVVAEGVEDAEAWEALVRLGCHRAQGFFFARPMPPDDCLEFIASHHRGGAAPLIAGAALG